MDIRYLTDDPEAIATVAKWIYEEWGHLAPGRTLETAHVKVRQSLGPGLPLTLLCYVDGALAGTAGIDSVDMSTHPELAPWMVSVFVAPARRRQGIATALCGRIREEFKKLGTRTAYLFTPDQERLYERLGWKTMSREEYRGETVTIMRLDLE
ncbi:MAG TPA: GNAT family N-acetyltransferase [bacterium]|nr:GNAT family N-acetyltransferase [bacterium]